jgi:hypothetical protein
MFFWASRRAEFELIGSGALLYLPRAVRRSACPLPHHLGRILVVSDSQKHRLTETIIPGPLGELDLAAQHGLDLMATLHLRGCQPLIPTVPTGCRNVGKWTTFNSNFARVRGQRAQKLPTESGPDSAAEL